MESPSRKAWEHLRPCPFSLHAEGASIVPWAPTAAGLCSGLGSLFSPASPRSKINSPYCGKVSWWALPILYRIGLGSAGSLSGWAISHRPHEYCLSGKALPRGPLGPGIPDPEDSHLSAMGALAWAPQWKRCQHANLCFSLTSFPHCAAASDT